MYTSLPLLPLRRSVLYTRESLYRAHQLREHMTVIYRGTYLADEFLLPLLYVDDLRLYGVFGYELVDMYRPLLSNS